MMNPELKQKWIAALESGEYKQARKVLYDGEGYCCLGVLCRVAGATFEHSGLLFEPPVLAGDRLDDGQCLNGGALFRFGIDDNEQTILIGLNDGRCKSFKEIAAYIRENL